ncbi:hypothetical protein AAG570_000787 [Ranatra chinensis]|uniref:Uncharacterized protein n=1 Tax=Ranatra chinensis TaxID=642074 RepID=A0ABD0YY50_9HEMI
MRFGPDRKTGFTNSCGPSSRRAGYANPARWHHRPLENSERENSVHPVDDHFLHVRLLNEGRALLLHLLSPAPNFVPFTDLLSSKTYRGRMNFSRHPSGLIPRYLMPLRVFLKEAGWMCGGDAAEWASGAEPVVGRLAESRRDVLSP